VVKAILTGSAQGVTDIVARAKLIFDRNPMPVMTKKTPAPNRYKPRSAPPRVEKA
jgi:hypothetical protein